MSFEEADKMPELQIIGAPQSNYVCVTRIACLEKGVPHTLVPVAPHSPEVDAIHPFGKIPVMRHGEVTLSESRAICYYIDHAFDGPPLAPRDPVGGARAEEWISLVNTHIDPLLVRRYLLAYFFPNTPDGRPDRAAIDAVAPKMEEHFALLDRAVAETGYLVGDRFTLADINLLPILFYMNKMPESGAMLHRATRLEAYYRRHMARPSAAEAAPPPFPGRED
jgi:glutathione S-transferase